MRAAAFPVAALLSVLSLGAADAARAQFTTVPAPITVAYHESAAETLVQYRHDAARHIYATYPMRIYKGKLPPLMYAIAVVETEIDERGQVVGVSVVREPAAAKEVTPWIVSMIRRAGPFPAMTRAAGHLRFSEVWLVNKNGKFQLDSLTEGQASE